MAEGTGEQPFRVRFALPLTLFPFVCGIGTAIPLWGEHADRIFFATAAEVIALGAVAMALQGSFFRVTSSPGRRGGWGLATILISVGVGLAFAFGALARADGGADPHLALTAGALSMGIAAFAVQALFGTPGAEQDD
jgi:hypothetical protein